jgi:hypothetical protein
MHIARHSFCVHTFEVRATQEVDQAMIVRNVTPLEAIEMTLEDYGPISADIGVALDGPMTHRGVVFYQSEATGVMAGLWEIDAGGSAPPSTAAVRPSTSSRAG